MTGALIAIGAWVGFLVAVLVFLVGGCVYDDHRTRRLRARGDREWERDEVAMWRCNLDPSDVVMDELEFHLLLPDATPGAW